MKDGLIAVIPGLVLGMTVVGGMTADTL